MELSRHRASFQPKARLISVLGDQLISDNVVGVLELVKNAYDADARCVTVSVAEVGEVVAVEDDGSGMTLEDVMERFLAPATDNKARSKAKRSRSPQFNRLPIGEKGVGRFAVHKLGRRLRLTTRAAGRPEVVVELDWDEFDGPGSDRSLSDVTFDVVERVPAVFTGEHTGTRLEMIGARFPWTTADLEKLHRGLRRLKSPHADAGKLDFDVRLVCPGHPAFESLDVSDIRERYHFRFLALVNERGMLEFEYHACHPAGNEREVTRFNEEAVDLRPSAGGELASRPPVCGPFYLNLYVWDRTSAYLQASGVSRAELDAASGVSLFRDDLRVLPYGEPGDDWLFLDRDRINSPASRLGNNQVIGYVEIQQLSSGELRDKTNREGLIDNEAFRDLRSLVRAAIRQFEALWKEDRPKEEPSAPETSEEGPERKIARARALASAAAQTARDDIFVEGPPRPGGGSLGEAGDGAPTPTPPSPRVLGEQSPPRLTQREALTGVVRDLDDALTGGRAAEEHHRREREILLHLAGVGLAAERLAHEFGRQASVALQALEKVGDAGGKGGSNLRILRATLGTLRNEFRGLSPEGGVTRFERRRQVSVREAVETALALNAGMLEERGLTVAVSGGDLEVWGRPASLVQVFDNLVNNAAHWARAAVGAGPSITVALDVAERQLDVADNGTGVQLERPDSVFEPFVSTRPDGHGLGLYIARELIRAEGGDLRVLPSETGRGATFRVVLPTARKPTP